VLDCGLEQGVDIIDRITGTGIVYEPGYRYRDEKGQTCRGHVVISNEMFMDSMLSEIEWKEDVSMYGYRFDPSTDCHLIYLTGPTLPPLVAGSCSCAINLNTVIEEHEKFAPEEESFVGSFNYEKMMEMLKKVNPGQGASIGGTSLPWGQSFPAQPWTSGDGNLGGVWSTTTSGFEDTKSTLSADSANDYVVTFNEKLFKNKK